MKRDDNKLFWAYGMYILSLLIFGSNGYYVAHISLSSSHIVLIRTLIGGAFLTGLVVLSGGFDKKNLREERLLLIAAGATVGLNWITLFEAYRLLNVSLATLIYYVGPIIALLFSPLLFHEKLTVKKSISILIVVIGLIPISGSIVLTGMNTLGLVIAILAAFLYAILLVINKRITKTSSLQTAAIEISVAFVVVLIYNLFTAGLPHVEVSDLRYIAILGFVNTGLACLLYFSGMQKLSGQTVALVSYLDPVSSLFFSAILLHEVMTPIQLIGAVLIIGGAILGELK